MQSEDGSAPFDVSLEGGEVVFQRREGQDIPGDDDLVAGQQREMSASSSDRIVSTLPGSPWRAQRPCN